MNILVFSNYFRPEIGAAPNRLFEHARYWVRDGHQVTVITSIPNSPFGKIYPGYKNSLCQVEEISGVQVKRVFTIAAGKKDGIITRGISVCIFLIFAIIKGVIENKPDLVISTAPYLTGIPGLIASKRFRVPHIYEMRDPWNQVIASHNIKLKKSKAIKCLKWMEKTIIRYSDRLVVIGNEMAKLVKNDYNLPFLPEVVHNAISTSDDKIKANESRLGGLEKKFVVGLIGNMGNQYDFDIVLKAAMSLKNEEFYFMFLGEGTQKKRIMNLADGIGLKNIGFYKAVPTEEIDSWIRKCDVTLVSMKDGPIFRVYIPVKVLDSLKNGIPVLFGGRGEIRDILGQSKSGDFFDPGDINQLINLLSEKMKNRRKLKIEGNNGSRFIYKTLTREKMAKKYVEIFDDVYAKHLKITAGKT